MIDLPTATQLVRAAMERYPELTPSGFTQGLTLSSHTAESIARLNDPAYHAERRAQMTEVHHMGQFIRAYAYLFSVPRVQKINPNTIGSYGLKHYAENWWDHFYSTHPEAPGRRDGYVSNGMLIAACHAHGLRIERDSINALFNISGKLPAPPGYFNYKPGADLDFSEWVPLLASFEQVHTTQE